MEIVLNFFNYHKDNFIFFEFRIRCIMLILEKLNNHIPSVTILRTLTIHMPEDLTLTSIQPFPYV